jgi:hypothetical protein
MKTHILRVWLYIILCISFWTCKSSNSPMPLEQLPPATQTGAKTLGALVDGVANIPTGSSGFAASDPVIGGYIAALPPVFYNKSNVWIRTVGGGAGFTIYLRNVDKVGTYPLNFDTTPAPQSLYPQNYASCSNGIFYTTTSTHTGIVEITRADTINRIVSGRFSFTGLDRTTGKTVKVTEGRFDCKTGN